MESIYRAEDGCDQWVAENLKLPEQGFFVDVGCAHPDRYSQTHWLRFLGWRGLAIDGDPAYAKEWEGHETTFVNAVLAGIEGVSLPFLIEPTNSLVSRVHPEGKDTPTRKLSSVLREYGVEKIDFLSIDIEASEWVVLWDLFEEGFRPDVIVAEYHSEHAGRDARVIEVIIRRGYHFVHMTNSNGVFVLHK